MRRFAALFEVWTPPPRRSQRSMRWRPTSSAADRADAAWAVYVLIGRPPQAQRRACLSCGRGCSRRSELPAWLVEETYASVGDLAETIALLVPEVTSHSRAPDTSLTGWLGPDSGRSRVRTMRNGVPGVVGWWRELPYRECFLVNKMLTGSLRVGVSRSLVTRALAEFLGQPRAQIERALIGEWQPSAEFWGQLARNEANLQIAHPYPFYLASPLEGSPAAFGRRGRMARGMEMGRDSRPARAP